MKIIQIIYMGSKAWVGVGGRIYGLKSVQRAMHDCREAF